MKEWIHEINKKKKRKENLFKGKIVIQSNIRIRI